MFAGFSARLPSPLSALGAERLSALGLTREELAWYSALFVGNPFDSSYHGMGPKALWTRLPKPLGLTSVVGHLEGRHWVATCARMDSTRGRRGQLWTPFVVIDLDEGDDLRTRLRKVIRALGTPSFVVKSSVSRGLHVYYVLEEPQPLYDLRDDRGKRGVVLALLAAEGIPERAGVVEVYPRGSTVRFKKQNTIRLPFGSGCVLVDSQTLNPMNAPAGTEGRIADLRSVMAAHQAGTLPLANVQQWLCRLPKQALGVEEPETRRKPAGGGSAGRADAARRLWREGITRHGQFNETIRILATDLWFRQSSEADAKTELHAWIDTHHHGQSDTYTRSAAEAHAEIDAVAGWVFKNGPYVANGELPELSVAEASYLLHATRPGVTLYDPETGEEVDRTKLRKVLFASYRLAKQRVLSEGNAIWRAKTAQGGPKLEDPTDSVMRAARRLWPRPDRPQFHVIQPWRMWLDLKLHQNPSLKALLKCVDRNAIPAYKRAARSLGLIPVSRPAKRPSIPGGKDGECEIVRVLLDFGALSPSGETFATVDDAVRILGDAPAVPSDFLRTYSRGNSAAPQRAASRIQTTTTRPESGAARDCGPLSPFETLIRGTLMGVINIGGKKSASRAA